jgi:hypothetical protein
MYYSKAQGILLEGTRYKEGETETIGNSLHSQVPNTHTPVRPPQYTCRLSHSRGGCTWLHRDKRSAFTLVPILCASTIKPLTALQITLPVLGRAIGGARLSSQADLDAWIN